MDYLKAQLDRLQQQLTGLNASQKMLTATLVIIMVITLVWWGRYAGTPEMEPVLNQSFSQDDLSRVTARIQSRGIPYKVTGDKVYVPSERKFEVLADLGYAQLLPRDTKTGFDDIIKSINPFMSGGQMDAMWNKGKEATLAQVIRNFPNVSNAMVIIDAQRRRGFGEGNIQPSATINITMRSGDRPGKQLIDAAADVVAGSESGLSRSKISVVVDGVSYPVHEKGQDGIVGSSDRLELMQSHERWYSSKIAEQLRFIAGVMVSVTVELNAQSVHETSHMYDPTKVAQKEVTIKSRTEETTSAQDAGGEPGGGANIQANINDTAAPSGNSSTVSEDNTQFENRFSEATKVITTPAGEARVVAASVRVPRSFFITMFKRSNPSVTDPTDAVLQPIIDNELAKILKDVKACTGLKDDAAVTVDTYSDAMPIMAAASSEVASSGVTSMLTGHTKEIVIGALAVVSLFMVSMMIRKSTPVVTAPIPTEESEPIQFVSEAVAGQVGEGDTMLDGMELDEEAVKSQQMVEQVSTMVKENPEAAANLVKRWLNRT